MNQPSQGMQSCNLRVIVFWFFFFFPGAGITSLAYSQKCFVGCSGSRGLSDALSPFGKATYRTAEPPHWLFPDWWLLRWKGNPLKGRWWGLKEWIPKLKALDEVHEGNTHLQREKSASNAFQSGTLLFLQLFFRCAQWAEEERSHNILRQFLRPDKEAKYYHEVNKRINCHWMQCATLS